MFAIPANEDGWYEVVWNTKKYRYASESKVNVAITGASENGVFRSSEIENALSSSCTLESLDTLSISSDGLISDIHASSNYRANLIKEMAKRALKEIIT